MESPRWAWKRPTRGGSEAMRFGHRWEAYSGRMGVNFGTAAFSSRKEGNCGEVMLLLLFLLFDLSPCCGIGYISPLN